MTPLRLHRRARIFLSFAVIGAVLSAPSPAAETAAVFDRPPAAYQPSVLAAADHALLRRIAVEERMGIARRAALVRVPLFFAAGECPDPDRVAIEDASGRQVYPTQADDVRRGPDGGVSRMHLWFAVDLGAWERKAYRLVRTAAPSRVEQSGAAADGDRLSLPIGKSHVVLGLAGRRAGRLLQLGSGAAPVLASAPGLSPRVVLTVADAAAISLPGDSAAEVDWADGPLFAEVRATWRDPGGAALEQVYRIPREGDTLTIEQTVHLPAGKKVVLKERELLAGEIATTAGGIEAVPAGLRRELRSVAGSEVSALLAPTSALLVVPVTSGGNSGRMTRAGAEFVLHAPAHVASASKDAPAGTVRAFWTAADLVVGTRTGSDELWENYCAHVQPLVAVVDEPGAGRADLQDALQGLIREMKPIGWRQEAGRAAALGHAELSARVLATKPRAGEADPDALVHAAEAAWARISQHGAHHLREDEKARASGPLDPYEITYTQSPAAVLEAMGRVPVRVAAIDRARAEAARRFLGRTDAAGFPYLDCFARALNMQMGATLFGLVADRSAPGALSAFYRDLAGAPAVRAVYGRAQRPYASRPGEGGAVSDALYQSVVDCWLRTAELTSGEDLELHPLAYARYTDCVDVMADLYHGADAGDKTGQAPPPRANFWRAQPHTHRWLGWACAPFIRLLERPGDLTGATEAIHYCEMLRGRWKNWPDLSYYLLAALLTREDFHAAPAVPRLPRPTVAVAAEKTGGGVRVTWKAVPGAVTYRVYRADREGAAPRWLDSPYATPAVAPAEGTSWHDTEGKPSNHYIVTAVDVLGRESRWFGVEPGR